MIEGLAGLLLCVGLAVAGIIGLVKFIGRAVAGLNRSQRPGGSPATAPASRPRSTAGAREIVIGVEIGGDEPPDNAQWFGPGQAVRVRGRELTGLIYVGRHLSSVGGYQRLEPALINPDLPTDERRVDWNGKAMPYWPSYSEIRPECRAAYLRWLADGRRDPSVGVGYVFLFLYGLERRVLHDGPRRLLVPGEIEVIGAEVERLLGIYGSQPSFRRYGGDFLTIVQLQLSTQRYSDGPPPPVPGDSFEFPLAVSVGLAEIVADRRPIPADWALAWVRAHPETRLRMPAQRCVEEFERLFATRYSREFGAGISVKPNRSRITAQYKPASASFGGTVTVPVRDLPDITALSAPVRRLREIADSCSDDLDAYSRFLGREPTMKGTINAIALLPPDLASHDASSEAYGVFGYVRDQLATEEVAIIPALDLLQRWSAAAADGRFVKAEAVTLSRFLQKGGFGIEPDVRFGGRVPKPEDKVALFRLEPGAAAAPTAVFRAAAALVHMAALVAQADGSVDEAEQAQLLDHVESALHLDAHERRRLHAHLQEQIANGAKFAEVKKNVGHLDRSKRNTLASFLVGVAAADGRLDRKEIGTLAKLYAVLEVEETQLYDDLHSFGLSRDVAGGPVTVTAAQPASGFSIPAPRQANQESSFTLDPVLVQAKLAESAAVAALLEDIFTQEDGEAVAMPPAGVRVPGIAGLDAVHSALLRELAAKTVWPRSQLEACAARLSIMPDSAIEVINECALDLTGEAVFDGEDPVSVNSAVLRELMA